jgi:hypothetical protein
MEIVISTVAAMAAFIAAVVGIYQAKRLSAGISVDTLFKLTDEYTEREESCSEAATGLLAANGQWSTLSESQSEALEDVLNFFDLVGHLVKKGALDLEMAYSYFFDDARLYWNAAKDYIAKKRTEDTWEDFIYLQHQLASLAKKRGFSWELDDKELSRQLTDEAGDENGVVGALPSASAAKSELTELVDSPPT